MQLLSHKYLLLSRSFPDRETELASAICQASIHLDQMEDDFDLELQALRDHHCDFSVKPA
jgi:hypothetical protein